MKEDIKLINGIYDIISPTEPVLSLYDYTIIVILIAVFSAIMIYASSRFININKIRISRKILHIKIARKNNLISSRDAAYQLCSLMHDGLKIQKISPNETLPENIALLQSRWNIFAEILYRLRYQKTDAQPVDENYLFDESLFWLRIWP